MEQIKHLPGGVGLEGWEAVDRTVELLAAARKNGIPVIHITKLDSDGVIGWGGKRGGKPMNMPEEIRRRASDIVEEVAPFPEKSLFVKRRPARLTARFFRISFVRWASTR